MVVDDPVGARALCAEGRNVVVVVAPGAPLCRPAGPGRLAVFVGDPEDAAVRAGAAEMDAELFGSADASP
ncbi:MAG TPA: hypothetical protein VFN68_12160 [Acidimicrobiales bacterium]|nr:hypothetical protein [Acidimicrobiales bacterium]